MHYGIQYYPEHWPEERWGVDAEMMRRAGINVVRMGEFAWSAVEPEEGKYDFEWLDRAIALLNDHGIKTIICTMSRTPPPWAARNYPGILNTALDGSLNRYGHRYMIGLSHPEFVEISQRIDRKVIEHFAGNDAIVGWQIDNEIGAGNDCYCEGCLSRFHDYLRKKYGTTENLNKRWGSHFWSIAFSDFSEVPLPSTDPHITLEYRRFMSEVNVNFAAWRARRIRELDPGKWVTTNFQALGVTHTDYRELSQTIDVNGVNNYPVRTPELTVPYYRIARKGTLVVEQCAGMGSVDIGEGWMRLWAYRALAHGASGIIFFRWRYCRWGKEQLSHGMLPHSGNENRQYRELARMGEEIGKVGDTIGATEVEARTAIVFSYDSRWTSSMVLDRKFGGIGEAVRYHKALVRRNVATDATDPREVLAAYRLVIAPRLFSIDEAAASNLRAFVEAGGVLCLTAASGVVDEYGKCFDTPRPGLLADAAGIEVAHLAPLADPTPLASRAIPGVDGVKCSGMADEIQTTTARTLAEFAGGWRRGTPAITESDFGKGKIVYVGAVLAGQGLDALLKYLCGLANVEGIMQTPEGVCAYERQGPEHRLLFLLNYTDTKQTVSVPNAWQDAFTGDECREVEINPVDLRLLKVLDKNVT